MLLDKFVPNSTNRRCSSGIISFNFDAKLAPNLTQICPKLQQKVHNVHHFRKFIQKRCQKGVLYKYLIVTVLFFDLIAGSQSIDQKISIIITIFIFNDFTNQNCLPFLSYNKESNKCELLVGFIKK